MSPSYVLKRMLYILLTLLVVAVTVFGITQVLPGSAAQMILGQYATPSAVHALQDQLGLNKPVIVQFGTWLGHFVIGDWGMSMTMSRPVLPLVLGALGRSLLLALPTLILVTLLAIPLGVLAATRRGKPIDLFVSFLGYLGVSVPEFVTGTILIVLFARPSLRWFPAGGFDGFASGILPALHHLALPVFTLTIILLAHVSRQTRSEMIDVLKHDYIRTATLKGLPRRLVLYRHALRNALLPTITVIALDVGYLLGGIVVVEEVFAYPGIGRQLIYAIQNRDLPLIQAAVLVIALSYTLANLVADLLYAYLDKRIQYG